MFVTQFRFLSPKFFLLTFLLGIFSCPTLLEAAQPSLSVVEPWGIQRGQETEVLIRGARLSDAKEVLWHDSGIKVTKLDIVNASTVKVKLKVDPNCKLGNHALRVRTATGISNLRLISIGALKELKEVEPNNEFKKPQPISLDSTVNGIVQNEDVDYYVVEAKKGQRITAEIEGLRLGYTFFDPSLTIMDDKRFELDTCDDDALTRQDAVCSIIAPKDGKYIIQVRESSFGGNGSCRYRLHIGRFAQPKAILPAGGKPGETIDVKWLGDVAGEKSEKIILPKEPMGIAKLFRKDEQGVAPTANLIRLSNLTNVLEVEENNDFAKATPFTAPAALAGVIQKPGDIDCFAFAAKKGQRYEIRVFARKLRSPLDSVIHLFYQKTGSYITGNDDSGGPDSYLRFTAPADDTFVIRIMDHLKSGSINHAYRIEVSPVQRALTMGLPERSRYVATTISVPQGNRMAFLVSASRRDFGGDLNVRFDGLPTGTTAQSIQMRSNRTTVPILVSAKADAPLAGSLVDVIGETVDKKLNVTGHFNQRNWLVRGQNNREVFSRFTDRMALAVTQSAKFKIDIVQPKVPIVRNGNMSLKIVATRQKGFNNAIAVRLLYNPPGIGSSISISIPVGKNEAFIPLTANSGAEVRDWKIAVIGSSGGIETSSQLATLSIQMPFVNFAFIKAAVEQGQVAEVAIKVNKTKEFAGKATIELLGLPAGCTTTPLEMTKENPEIVFKVKTLKTSPAGKHTTLLCRVIFTESGEPVTHMLYGGQLRIDKPLPPKVVKKPVVKKATPKPKPVAKAPVKKRLSRLEQLRLDRKNNK